MFRHFSGCGFAWLGHYFFVFSGFQKQRFGIFSDCSFAMAWVQNLLGFCFFACGPKHLFLEFGLVACRLPSLTLRKGLPSVFAWLGHDFWLWSNCGVFDDGAPPWDFFCCVSLSAPLRQRHRTQAFLEGCLQRLPKHCFLWVPKVFLVGSKSDVSGFFRLQFRNGLGAKLAGVLLFRMRVQSTFFMGFVWWLAGFQVLRCAKVCLAWGNFFSLFLVGSKSSVSAFFWLLEATFFLCF